MKRATSAAMLMALAVGSCAPLADHSAGAPVPLRMLSDTPSSGGPEVTGVVEAWTIDGTLYALEQSPLTLVAIDMATHSRRFRRPLAPTATGPFQLVRAGRGEVALFTTRAAFRYAADGHLIEAHKTGIEAPTHTQSREGVCAVGNACAEQLFDCETARPVGPVFRGGSITLDGELFAACSGPRLVAVGRSDQGLLFVNGRFEDVPGVSPNQADSLVSVDPQTGVLRFVTPLWLEMGRPAIPGIDPSGQLVAFVMTNGEVVSYTTSGKVVATTADRPPSGAKEGEHARQRGALRFTAWISGPRPTLLVNFDSMAEVVDVATGAYFQVPLRREELALVASARLSPFDAGPTADLRLRLIDPSSGDTKKTLRVGATQGFGSFGSSGLIEVPDQDRAWRMDLSLADPPRSPEARLEAQRDGMHTLVFDRYRKEPVLSVEEDAWVIGVERCRDRSIAAIATRAGGAFDVRLVTLPD